MYTGFLSRRPVRRYIRAIDHDDHPRSHRATSSPNCRWACCPSCMPSTSDTETHPAVSMKLHPRDREVESISPDSRMDCGHGPSWSFDIPATALIMDGAIRSTRSAGSAITLKIGAVD